MRGYSANIGEICGYSATIEPNIVILIIWICVEHFPFV